jgi:Ax21 family sulfation-dependent quorum factor
LTADAVVVGALAVVEPLCNTVAYDFHEKVWERIEACRVLSPPLLRPLPLRCRRMNARPLRQPVNPGRSGQRQSPLARLRPAAPIGGHDNHTEVPRMKRSILALGLLAALPFAATASDLSYSYVEGGYSRVNGLGAKTDGYVVNGSIAIGAGFHAFGGYEALDIDRARVDADSWNLGFGYAHSLNQSTDLVARLGYSKFDLAGPLGINLDGESYFSEVGVRSQLAPQFEGYIFAGYERPDGGGGDSYGRIGGQYNINKSWGLIADVKFGDGVEQYFFGPRLSF